MINLWKLFQCVTQDRHDWWYDNEVECGYCRHCNMRITLEAMEAANEHRARQARHQSGTGTLSLPAPGKCAGGAESAQGTSGAGICACGHPVVAHSSVGCSIISAATRGFFCTCVKTKAELMNPLLPAPSLEPITQEVLAWRGWSLNWAEKEQGWFLYSVNHDVRWDGPSLMADKVPDSQNTHGIYALADKGQLLLQGYGTQVLGEVALSGIVVEGERGYRAERATIRNLVVFGYPRPDVRPIEILVELENRYQCEVRWEQANESLYSADKAAIIQLTRPHNMVPLLSFAPSLAIQ